MDKFIKNYVEGFMADAVAKNPGESGFHQAVREVVESVAPYLAAYPHLMDLRIMKFLAFEQTFKSSLRGQSDNEVMRFCQSFMTELQRHIGPDIAGFIKVAGAMAGQGLV